MRLVLVGGALLALLACSKAPEAKAAVGSAPVVLAGGLEARAAEDGTVTVRSPVLGALSLRWKAPAGAPVHHGEAGELTLSRPGAVERWRAVPRGLEQTFEFAARADLPARVELALSGATVTGEDGAGLWLAVAGAAARVHYGHGTLVDAMGRRWPVPARAEAGGLVLELPPGVAQDAAFPVVLDPLITAQVEGALPTVTAPVPNLTYAGPLAIARVPTSAVNVPVSLVVWTDQRSPFGFGLYGALSLDLASGPSYFPSFLIARGGTLPAVAASADQSAFEVTWVAADGTLQGALIPAVGTDAPVFQARALTSATGATPGHPTLARTGTTGYLLAWECTRNVGPLCGLYLDTAGAPRGAVLTLADGAGTETAPVATWDDARVAVAWVDSRSGTNRVWLGASSGSGALLAAPVDPAGTGAQTAPSITGFAGVTFSCWTDARNSATAKLDLYGAFLYADGGPNYPVAVANAPGDQLGCVVNRQGPRYQFTWLDNAPDGGTALRGRLADNWASASPDYVLRQAPTLQYPTFTDFVVGDPVGGPNVGRVVFVDNAELRSLEHTAPSGAAPALVSQALASQLDVSIAAGSSSSLALWSTFTGHDGGYDLFYRRLSPTGTWLDAAPRPLAQGPGDQRLPHAAWGAGRWLVTWQDSFTPHATRVDDQGQVLDPDGGAVVGTPVAAAVGLSPAFDGTNFVVAYQRMVAGGALHTYALRYDPATLAPLDPGPGVDVFGRESAYSTAAVGGPGGQVLVVSSWLALPALPGTSPSGVAAARVANGVLLDRDGGLLLGGDAGTVAVTFDGADYLVAWSDWRAPAGTGPDVTAAHVTPSGVVKEPAGIALVTGPRAAQVQGLAFDGVHPVLAWSDLPAPDAGPVFTVRWLNQALGTAADQASEGGAGSVTALGRTVQAGYLAAAPVSDVPRATFLVGAALPLGAACATATDCASGQCVTGTCCDSACAGACQTCQGLGATPSGTCTYRGPSTVCRAAQGTCDVEERCTGNTPTCPGDARADGGTSCRASTGPCDVAEACDGVGLDCPANGYRDAGTRCLASSQPCLDDARCTGAGPTCPGARPRPQDTPCRPAAGPCDVDERCDGVNGACPADKVAPSTLTCRPAAGPCDVAEVCDGLKPQCPDDRFSPASSVCRPAAPTGCDVAEACSGQGAACPGDAPSPNGTACADDAGAPGTCQAGTCAVKVQSQYATGCAAGGDGGPLLLAGLALLLARRRRAAGGLLVLALAAAAPAFADGPPRLAFLGLTPGKDVDAADVKTVSDVVESELLSFGHYQVSTPQSIAATLGLERQRQLMGCSESECTAEVLGALSADRIVQGDLARLEGVLVFNLSLVDGHTSRALGRVGRRAEKGQGLAALLPGVHGMLSELLDADPLTAQGQAQRFAGLSLGVRGDVDVSGGGAVAGLTAEWATRWFGVALAVLPKATPGARLELRGYPLLVGPLRLHVAVGAVAFTTGAGVGARLGLTLALGPVRLGLDGGWEQFPWAKAGYMDHAAVVGAGAAWAL